MSVFLYPDKKITEGKTPESDNGKYFIIQTLPEMTMHTTSQDRKIADICRLHFPITPKIYIIPRIIRRKGRKSVILAL